MAAFTVLQTKNSYTIKVPHERMSVQCDSLHNLIKTFSFFSVFLSEICVITELEDLSASVDVQDVYTKIKCKVGSFNIDHYRCR